MPGFQPTHAADGSQVREESRVRVVDPGRMHMAGLMIAALIERRGGRIGRLSGDVLIEVGEMATLLRFAKGGVEVTRPGTGMRPLARVRGSLAAMAGAMAGEGFVGAALRRRIRARGRPLVLLRLLRLFGGDHA